MTAMSPTLIVTSLVGGVQASVIALTASEVAIDRMPNSPSSPAAAGSRPGSTTTWSG